MILGESGNVCKGQTNEINQTVSLHTFILAWSQQRPFRIFQVRMLHFSNVVSNILKKNNADFLK